MLDSKPCTVCIMAILWLSMFLISAHPQYFLVLAIPTLKLDLEWEDLRLHTTYPYHREHTH